MSRNAKERRGREIQDQIRSVLEESWDPIGLFPGGPESEYDAYIGPLYRLLIEEAGDLALTRYLMEAEATILGQSARHARHLVEPVRRLMALDVRLRPHLHGQSAGPE